jgi:hypothetical protein
MLVSTENPNESGYIRTVECDEVVKDVLFLNEKLWIMTTHNLGYATIKNNADQGVDLEVFQVI